MASSPSISFPALRFSSPGRKNVSIRNSYVPISASMEIPSPSTSKTEIQLPVRPIPGDYGLPLLGAIKDRLDYHYNQGRDEFFKSRAAKYNSTVFRVNMPPGPFISKDSRVIVLLDGKSFPVLFDVSKVAKKDLFTGTYMPSTDLTGGYRVLSYLDPSEPNHKKLKELIFFLIKSSRERVIPEFRSTFGELFETLESEISSTGKTDFVAPNEQASFNFLSRAFFRTNPADTSLKSEAPALIQIWLLFQLGPLLTIGLPKFLEDTLLHTFPLPPVLVKSQYKKLYDFFNQSAAPILDEAEKMGIKRDEACNNILFATCFNSYGGMKIFFPSLLKWIGRAGTDLQLRLAKEIRSAVQLNGGEVTMKSIEEMTLMKSTVYEVFRIEPPVPLQYGRAKRDLIIESHDAAFEVKKGEMLFGFQPFATKDPKIFKKPEEFIGDRFVGEGEKLLQNVFWSNGREIDTPTVNNKQCAGKDFVVLMARLLVVELFLRYDGFTAEAIGSGLKLTSMKKASF